MRSRRALQVATRFHFSSGSGIGGRKADAEETDGTEEADRVEEVDAQREEIM